MDRQMSTDIRTDNMKTQFVSGITILFYLKNSDIKAIV